MIKRYERQSLLRRNFGGCLLTPLRETMLTALSSAGKTLMFCIYDLLFIIYDLWLYSPWKARHLKSETYFACVWFFVFRKYDYIVRMRTLMFCIYDLSFIIYDVWSMTLLSLAGKTLEIWEIIAWFSFCLGITTTCGRMKSAGGLGRRLGAFFVSNKSNKFSFLRIYFETVITTLDLFVSMNCSFHK